MSIAIFFVAGSNIVIIDLHVVYENIFMAHELWLLVHNILSFRYGEVQSVLD